MKERIFTNMTRQSQFFLTVLTAFAIASTLTIGEGQCNEPVVVVDKEIVFDASSQTEVRGDNHEDELPYMDTDRSDFIESSTTVPRGRFLFENGFTWEDGPGSDNTFNLTETLIRAGIAPKTELRMEIPQYVRMDENGDEASGLSDMRVGFKKQLGPLPGDIGSAIIGMLSIPTGHHRISSNAVDPEILINFVKDLPNNWSAAAQLSASWPSDDGDHDFTLSPTFGIGRDFTSKLKGYLEYAADFPDESDDIHLLHTGVAYRLTPRTQADFHIGVGLSKESPDLFFGAGYIFLL